MLRLFTGIELPELVTEQLAFLRGGLAGAHWLDRENLHLTLRFVGDVPERQAELFAEELSQITFESFELELAGLGSFGGNKPRTLWAGFKPSSDLENLQKAHERAARRAGSEPETRNFVPHVTLARLRNTTALDMAEYLARRGALALPPFTVKRFVLMSARPVHGGGPYVIEEAFYAIDSLYDSEEEAYQPSPSIQPF